MFSKVLSDTLSNCLICSKIGIGHLISNQYDGQYDISWLNSFEQGCTELSRDILISITK